MDFVRYSDSIRSKLHLGGFRLPLLIGCTVCALLVIFAVVSSVVSALNEPVVTIDKAQPSEQATSSVSQDAQKTIFVHVAGKVANAGLYELPADARLQQAIDRAGGFSEGADTDALNLARQLTDGEQIIVPALSEQPQVSDGASASEQASGSTAQTTSKVNINTASLETLQTLKGIGASTAQRIIDDRTANGPYKTIEDLKRVSGIGDKKFASIASSICVG